MIAPEPKSYTELVWRDFKRNRLALLAGIAVLLVLVIAVLCPLLANQRPLYLKAVLRDDYTNAVSVLIEKSRTLLDAKASDAKEIEASRRIVRSKLSQVLEALNEPERTVAAQLGDSLLSGTNVDAAQVQAGWETLLAAELKPVSRWPAFRSLETLELFVLLLLPLVILFSVVLRKRIGLFPVILLASLLALLGTMAVRAVYPLQRDPTPYRRLLDSRQFAETGGFALRPPIPYGENENITADSRKPPTWLLPAPTEGERQNWHWLGTDTNGRDVLARMIYGARVSMIIGLFATTIYTIIGIVLGSVAGYYRGFVDLALSRVIEAVICFPVLILILSVQAFLAPSLLNIILALSALWWTGVARLQRAEFLRLVNQDFVMSVRALGGSDLRIIFLHILPNSLAPVLVLVSFGIAGSIVVESALSFLGFGVPQPMASWGDLLNNGRNDVKGLWWLTVFPGLAIFLVVTCFNLLGEGIRDALDPRRDQV